MAEWSAHQTRSPEVPGSNLALTHSLDLFDSSLEFKSSTTLVNSQMVCLRPVGIRNLLRYVQFGLFVTVYCSAPLDFLL